MNREIKFRAWYQDKMWTDFSLNADGTFVHQSIGCVATGVNRNGNAVLMQFTGLHDKNGVEIYEGDIIDFDRREWGGDDNIHKVSWDAQEGAWSWGGGSSSDMEWRTVIGNVFENPELLCN